MMGLFYKIVQQNFLVKLRERKRSLNIVKISFICSLLYFLILKKIQIETKDNFSEAIFEGNIVLPFDGESPWNFEMTLNKNLSALEYLLASEGSSWIEITVILDVMFPQKDRRLFFEFDAKDGEVFGHSIYLEKYKSWNGVLVTSNPQNFQKLLEKRRKVYAVNVCPKNFYLPYFSERNFKVYKEIIPKKISSNGNPEGEYFKIQADEYMYNHQILRHSKSAESRIIRCLTLPEVIQILNLTKIDVLFLSNNGAELSVLKTIPFEKMSISTIVVAYQDKMTNLEKIIEFLRDHGYMFHNVYYFPECEASFVNKKGYNKEALEKLSRRNFFEIILKNTGLRFSPTDYDALKYLLSIVD